MEKFVAEQYQLTQDLSQLRETNNAGVERRLESKKQEGEIIHYTAEIKE
jgi:hypothetical protein